MSANFHRTARRCSYLDIQLGSYAKRDFQRGLPEEEPARLSTLAQQSPLHDQRRPRQRMKVL